MHADAAFWNKLAEFYAAKPVDDPAAFDRKVAITRERIRPGDTVLNVGCGTGSLSLRLADTGATLHGVDISSEMVRIARAKVAAAGVDNIQFHVSRFEDFDAFGPASVDVLMAYSLVHLVDDIPGTLRQMHDLVRPGGVFISSTVVLGDGWMPYRPLLRVMYWLGRAPRVVQVVRRQDLLNAMAAAGF